MKELVGKGKPFYSALDRALETLPEKASPEQIVNHLIKMGVKPQEIIDRRMDKEVGAPLIPRERTVKLKKPDDKGRTEIVEPYFETTRVSGAKAIPRKVVSELAQKNPMVAPVEKVLGKMSDSEFLQRANDIAEQNFGVPYGQLDHEKQSSIEGYIDEDTSHHRGLTLPGGENYREMLIKAPEAKDLFKGVSSHFGGERGILASMRLKDRIAPGDMGYALVNKRSGNKSQIFSTPEEAQAAMLSMPESMRPMLDIVQTRGADKKLLHLEELQSDWHQQGREHGYIDPNEIWNITKKMIRNEPLTQEENNNYVSSQYGGPKVPNAPFKKNWEEMALKRLIHHAAEKGYHGIVVTPGHEQADRYSLKHHVGQVYAKPTGNGKYDVTIDQKNGDGFYDTARTGPIDINEIQNLIGKELAEKIASQDKEHTYSGLDLEVGGEGMKGFYDKKVPNILNSIGKKYGVKTQLHAHPIKTEREQMVPDNAGLGMIRSGKPEYAHAHHFPITENMRKDVLTNGLPLYAEGGGVPSQHRAQFEKTLADLKIRTELNKKYNDLYEKKRVENQPTIQEFYAMHGIQHKAEGGAVQPSLNHMRMALMTGGKIPYTDISNIGADEAPNMGVKAFINPNERNNMGPGGVQLPTGGIDMNPQQPGQQLMPQQPQQQPQGQPSPLSAGASSPLQQPPSNILQMTPQGQAMNAMTPPKMAEGGQVDGYASKGKVTKKSQTVKNAQRMAYPGIYSDPKEIAALAASRVAPEDPILKQLFGVTRADMYQQSKGRKGMPHLGMLPGAAANPKGSMATEGVMNKRNEQRLLDVMHEAGKHQSLVHGMDPWYYMDPLFNHMVKLLGLQKATEEYKKMNALMGMASSSSEVNTEIPRGSLAYYLQNQGRFDEFVKHGGKRDPNRPADFGEVPGHLAHKTAHALPMKNFLTHGAVTMESPKVPMYIEASGVPATGFQTRTPVGDAHWSRAVGLADTRNPKTVKGVEVVPGASVSTPEMSQLGPWWQHNIAAKLGLESVPAQARAWGAFSPQTGVTTPIGAPKLELIAKQIGLTAKRLGVTPETARDMVLTGKERMGLKKGGSARLSTNKDVMQLELTRKPKKAK